ncbi:transglutaminase-like domain-containing protein [Aridibaculum aurantiacum]|uniref:transglutaminase-like domain-containing protein n=1 Tax=Aridibaculum aurantiacum TaxID=2810307 RepID=UPI001A979872|nr:transglutaminase-like domain-containing protein [Aridibaculum aurantiacum]
MKKLFLLTLLFAQLASYAQTTYKGLPVIRANSMKADYRFNDWWSRGSWTISPNISPDPIDFFAGKNDIQFAFYTDIDSIAFPVNRETKKQFYVLTAKGDYALTEVRSLQLTGIGFDNKATSEGYKFQYQTSANNKYLQTLREQYQLDKVVENKQTETEKALALLHWVHSQWKHDGDNEPKKSDALSILAEVKEGKNFRCVEYGIVGTAAMNAMGMPARVLALKTKDVETTEYGAGHVLMEVFLKEHNKWVLMDGQFDVMPVLNNVPLNAVEFQHAIENNYDELELRSGVGTRKHNYVSWVYPYLYYFDIKFDNRQLVDEQPVNYNGKKGLMLVPTGAKQPTVFQKQYPITYCAYTNSLADFYAAPF